MRMFSPEQSTGVCLMIVLVHFATLVQLSVQKATGPGHPCPQSLCLFAIFMPSPGLCTSCGGQTLDPWRALGPGETESGLEACSQTSWRTCWHTPAADWSAPGWPTGRSLYPEGANRIVSFWVNDIHRLRWIRQMAAYLWTGQVFVLLPLSHFDWRQVSCCGDQEVHQDVLTVGGAIHESSQRLGQVVGEQVVIIPAGHIRGDSNRKGGEKRLEVKANWWCYFREQKGWVLANRWVEEQLAVTSYKLVPAITKTRFKNWTGCFMSFSLFVYLLPMFTTWCHRYSPLVLALAVQ